MVSIRTGKSPLEKLLKLNSPSPSRLSRYRAEYTTYFWLIKHNSDSVVFKAFTFVALGIQCLVLFSLKTPGASIENMLGGEYSTFKAI